MRNIREKITFFGTLLVAVAILGILGLNLNTPKTTGANVTIKEGATVNTTNKTSATVSGTVTLSDGQDLSKMQLVCRDTDLTVSSSFGTGELFRENITSTDGSFSITFDPKLDYNNPKSDTLYLVLWDTSEVDEVQVGGVCATQFTVQLAVPSIVFAGGEEGASGSEDEGYYVIVTDATSGNISITGNVDSYNDANVSLKWKREYEENYKNETIDENNGTYSFKTEVGKDGATYVFSLFDGQTAIAGTEKKVKIKRPSIKWTNLSLTNSSTNAVTTEHCESMLIKNNSGDYDYALYLNDNITKIKFCGEVENAGSNSDQYTYSCKRKDNGPNIYNSIVYGQDNFEDLEFEIDGLLNSNPGENWNYLTTEGKIYRFTINDSSGNAIYTQKIKIFRESNPILDTNEKPDGATRDSYYIDTEKVKYGVESIQILNIDQNNVVSVAWSRDNTLTTMPTNTLVNSLHGNRPIILIRKDEMPTMDETWYIYLEYMVSENNKLVKMIGTVDFITPAPELSFITHNADPYAAINMKNTKNTSLEADDADWWIFTDENQTSFGIILNPTNGVLGDKIYFLKTATAPELLPDEADVKLSNTDYQGKMSGPYGSGTITPTYTATKLQDIYYVYLERENGGISKVYSLGTITFMQNKAPIISEPVLENNQISIASLEDSEDGLAGWSATVFSSDGNELKHINSEDADFPLGTFMKENVVIDINEQVWDHINISVRDKRGLETIVTVSNNNRPVLTVKEPNIFKVKESGKGYTNKDWSQATAEDYTYYVSVKRCSDNCDEDLLTNGKFTINMTIESDDLKNNSITQSYVIEGGDVTKPTLVVSPNSDMTSFSFEIDLSDIFGTNPISDDLTIKINVSNELKGSTYSDSYTLQQITDTTTPTIVNIYKYDSFEWYAYNHDEQTWKSDAIRSFEEWEYTIGNIYKQLQLVLDYRDKDNKGNDNTEDLYAFVYYMVHEDGSVTEEVVHLKEDTSCGYDSNHRYYTLYLRLKGKGVVAFKAIDKAGNESDLCYLKDAIIIETDEDHNNDSICNISVSSQTSTSRKDSAGNEFFNNEVVDLVAKVTDNYSGIKEVRYSVIQNKDKPNANTLVNDEQLSPENTITLLGGNIISSASYPIHINQNGENLSVIVKMTDNLGNTKTFTYVFSVDKIKPEVTIKFDDNVKGDESFPDYYKEARTATITIKEKNFNEKSAEAMFTSATGEKPKMSGWTHQGEGDNQTHVTTVTFDKNGKYNLSVSVEDLAGNLSTPVQINEFTIDMEKPEVDIQFDKTNALSDYYSTSRTAKIIVKDLSFEPSRVVLEGTVKNSEIKNFPVPTGWTKTGDTWTGNIVFDKDGTYAFSYSAKDKAGNESEKKTVKEFTVDLTKPEINISGVKDKSANRGKVLPVIEIDDPNIDKSTIKLKLVGERTGEVDLENHYTVSEDGTKFTIDDFAYEKMADDVYTLTVTANDMAGNKTTQSITFSVNRFGSAYEFGEELQRINDKYVKTVGKIIFSEINVDELIMDSIKVTISINGVPKVLVKGKDYTVRKVNDSGSWNKYEYTLNEDLFTADGTYVVTVSSEDGAGNINEISNQEKESGIKFGIDTIAPIISALNIESDAFYKTNSYEALISIKDNLAISGTAASIDGKSIQMSSTDSETYTFTIAESNNPQNIEIRAVDQAGNESVARVDHVLVSGNILVRLMRNKLALFGILGGSGVVVVGGALFFILRRRF